MANGRLIYRDRHPSLPVGKESKRVVKGMGRADNMGSIKYLLAHISPPDLRLTYTQPKPGCRKASGEPHFGPQAPSTFLHPHTPFNI